METSVTTKKSLIVLLLVVALSAIAISIILLQLGSPKSYLSRPVGIMGTQTELTVIAKNSANAEAAFRVAETALRNVEAKMSKYLAGSEISAFNTAGAGEAVNLSSQTLEVLTAAKQLARRTDGAFDATIYPLIELWTRAAREGKVPTDQHIAAARSASSWELIQLAQTGATKKKTTVCVDLGGLAKGYAIDQAIEAMKNTGVIGGLVNIGGDIRCFGATASGDKWTVGVENPFAPDKGEFITRLGVREKAVCTSGDYRRFSIIDGQRYGHIIDPRTGMPTDSVASVTVVAPSTIVADGWATALSVLGPAGLKLLKNESGIEAMLITAGPIKVHMTDGFSKLLTEPVSMPKAAAVER